MIKFFLALLLCASSLYALDWKTTEGPLTNTDYNSFVKKNFCDLFNQKINKYGWGKVVCNPNTWKWDQDYITPKGYPLLYQEFEVGNIEKNTTLVFCAVHGDELPTTYLCIHLVRDILFDNPKNYQNAKIVIAPMLNPDGFFIPTPTRTNANGIDINRNFPTKDFDTDAIKSWKTAYHSDPRRYPGTIGGSEIETKFQIELINRYKPEKIISIHSPYGWLDVDIPPQQVAKTVSLFFQRAKDVGHKMSKESNNYPLTNFKIFPGSLGNYAAYERHIPTYTLELPKSASNLAHPYWTMMSKGFAAAINYQLSGNKTILEDTDNEKQDYISDED